MIPLLSYLASDPVTQNMFLLVVAVGFGAILINTTHKRSTEAAFREAESRRDWEADMKQIPRLNKPEDIEL